MSTTSAREAHTDAPSPEPRPALVPAPAVEDDGPTPDDTWSLDDLRQYTRTQIDEANLLARRSSVRVYRAGRALSMARARLKGGKKWVAWQHTTGLSRTSVWEAVKLLTAVTSEDEIRHLTITDAKEKFNITRKRHREEELARREGCRRVSGATSAAPSAHPAGAVGSHLPPADNPVDEPARDLDAIRRTLGQEYREAITTGEAQLSPVEIRRLATPVLPKSTKVGHHRVTSARVPEQPVLILTTGKEGLEQVIELLPPPTAGEVGESSATAACGSSDGARNDEEVVDEERLSQLVNLWGRANQSTRLAFLNKVYVRAAICQLHASTEAAA